MLTESEAIQRIHAQIREELEAMGSSPNTINAYLSTLLTGQEGQTP